VRQTDIAVVGGGLAGSIAAAMLGRMGFSALLIDPNPVYPPELRCEKISGGLQLDRLRKTGLAEVALKAAKLDDEVWIARFGRLIDKRPSLQYGLMYDTFVNAVRAAIPACVGAVHAKVTSVSTSPQRQTLVLSNGEQVSARLVVLANGLNPSVRHALGIERRIISACHSITVGFDIEPVGRPTFEFPALTYFSERTIHRTAYLTLFPIASGMRANLFAYRPLDDPWLRQMRRSPEQALDACLPRLRRLTGAYKANGEVKIRSADLYVSAGHRQHGIVLVGDAFASPCPGSGTGTDKVFTDVERLCHHHIPNWLASEGMDETKISQFYDDPIKTACDAWAEAKAFELRSVTIDDGLVWQARRWARFLGRYGEGAVRRSRARINPRKPIGSVMSSAASAE
jgi:2-polyprenyl-6-methoxyphenol hydroxylase-like FAD-dependent oxidoreductase